MSSTIILPKPDTIPLELRQQPRWVAWTYKNDGSKLPLDPLTGRAASSTDPKTWSTFDAALRYARQKGLGIGFILARDDDFVGLDFDNCIDEHGNIDAATYDVLQTLSSYSEVSPSGRGIKTIVKAHVARAYKNERIEIYPHSRFFCVTGDVVPGLPTTIRDAQAAVDALIRECFPNGNGHKSDPLPGRIAEGARNNTLTSLAGSLRRRGLPESVIQATLVTVNQSQCNPPLSEDEVRRIAASVSRYEPAERHHRHITRGNDDDDAREPIDLATLPEPGPQRFVVADFIPEGYITNLYADSGQGKSYLALHLALAVITGSPFLGRDVKQGKVLYLDWELDEVTQRRRWGEVCRGQGYEKPPTGLYYVRMTKPLVDSLDEAYYWLDSVHPVLVIVDSVGKAVGTDPVDHRAIISFYSKVETLGTVLAIDHQPKPGGDTNYGAKWEFGSSYKRHLARSSWQLERVGVDENRIGLVLRHKKTNFSALCADVHAVLTFENGINPKSVKLELVESATQMAGGEFGIRSAILAELGKNQSTAEQLAEALDYDLGSIKNAITALKRAGLIGVVGREGRASVYGLVPTVQNERHHRHISIGNDDDDECDDNPEGLRGEILALAGSHSWPEAVFAPGRKVMAGEANWRKVTRWCSIEDLRLIARALKKPDDG